MASRGRGIRAPTSGLLFFGSLCAALILILKWKPTYHPVAHTPTDAGTNSEHSHVVSAYGKAESANGDVESANGIAESAKNDIVRAEEDSRASAQGDPTSAKGDIASTHADISKTKDDVADDEPGVVNTAETGEKDDSTLTKRCLKLTSISKVDLSWICSMEPVLFDTSWIQDRFSPEEKLGMSGLGRRLYLGEKGPSPDPRVAARNHTILIWNQPESFGRRHLYGYSGHYRNPFGPQCSVNNCWVTHDMEHFEQVYS